MRLILKRVVLPAILLAAILFVGCATSTTPGSPPIPPTPPQVTVANINNLFSVLVDGTAHTAAAARDAGKLSQSDVTAIDAFLIPAAHFGLDLDAELKSPDPWATQKTVIVQKLTAYGLGQLKGHVSPTALAIINGVLVAINQISTAVGGPTI